MSDKHMPHTHKKAVYARPWSFFNKFNKLFFDVGNTLKKFQGECEETFRKT